MKFIAISILSFTFLLSSCLKKSENAQEEDYIPPIINLTTPTDGQVFTGDVLVNISGVITDNKEIAEIHVHIYNQATSQLIADIHQYPNKASYNLNESFMALKGNMYKIQVIAIDRSINQQVQTVTITVN